MNYNELGEILSTKDHFTTLSKQHRKKLIQMVNRVLCGENVHVELIPLKEIGSVSFHSIMLKKWFRKKSDSGYYKKVIEPYFDCVNDGYSFGWGKGKTKKYKLKKWIYDLCEERYNNPKPIQLSKLVNTDVEPIKVIPSNGVNDLDINGHPKSSSVYINPIVYPNRDVIENTIVQLEKSKSSSIRKHIRDSSLFQLHQWMNNLNNDICNGGVLQLYQEGINGRLNPQEGCDFPHLINTPNRLRRVLLDELELWDYDMSNSHLSMFLGLCERYDLRCPNIGEYVGNKSVLRDEWSYEFNVKTEDLKQYIISWLYGNHMNEIKPNPFYEKFGYEKLEMMKNNEILVGIYKEIIKGRKIIVDNHTIGKNRIKNIMGKEFSSTKLKSKLCFILFGYESKVLDLVNEVIGDDMIVLIYDGWIGEKTDVSVLENHIKKNLDMDIRFDEELIKRPQLYKLK